MISTLPAEAIVIPKGIENDPGTHPDLDADRAREEMPERLPRRVM